MNNITVDNAHLSLCILVHTLSSKLFLALVGDKANDVINLRNNLCHKVSRPLLESLTENCVVCIVKCLSCNFKSVVKVEAFVHKKSYKLGNT